MTEEEIALTGGNLSTVLRVGDTIRRSAGPWTPTIHALLLHLERVGFEGAPRALGVDDEGREILSYIKGDVFRYPPPPFVWSDETLVAAAQLVRQYHDAVLDFDPGKEARWQFAIVPQRGGQIICHCDIAPHNTVFVEDKPVAFIDWDGAAPADPIWDVAYAVWHYVPLWEDPAITIERRAERILLFCDSYGLTDRSRLLATVRQRQGALYEMIVKRGSAGEPGWKEQLRDGQAEAKLRDMDYLDRHRNALEVALRDP